jgi:hypothetical protein
MFDLRTRLVGAVCDFAGSELMRKIAIASLLALILMVGAAQPAYASSAGTVSGTYTFSNGPVTLVQTLGDGSKLYSTVTTIHYTGQLSGTSTFTNSFIIFTAATSALFGGLTACGAGTEICTDCVLAGISGSYRASAIYEYLGANFRGVLFFNSGTGGLAGITGGGPFQGTRVTNSYSYQYRIP